MTTDTPMEVVTLVLLSKLYLIRNRIRKIGLLQTVPIIKSQDIRKAAAVCAHTPLICVFTNLGLTRTLCPVKGYITYLVPSRFLY